MQDHIELKVWRSGENYLRHGAVQSQGKKVVEWHKIEKNYINSLIKQTVTCRRAGH